MTIIRRNAIIAGVLVLVGMLAGILSVAPAIDSTEYLTKASANSNQVIIGAIFQFLMSIAYLGFAISLYPFIKKYNEGLALGFLSFRILAAILIIFGTILLVSILALSHEYGKLLPKDTAFFETLGNLLKIVRDLINHVFMILVLCIGNLMFYVLLFNSKLIPQWISVWGLIGAALSAIASVLVLFKVLEIITPEYLIFNTPTALQELVLAVFLIFRGFNKPLNKSNTTQI